MKSSDTPALEPQHPLAPKTETRFTVKKDSESDEFAPRYVDLPQRRHAVRAGRRNLFWGIALLCAALLVLVFAVLLGGPRAVLWPLVSMLTFTALWVLARLKIFRQRNGVFFALALVTLLGSGLAVCERALDRLAGRTAIAMPNVSTSAPGDALPAPEPEPPFLSEALSLTPPDPTEGSRVKILQDAQVTIARKIYRVRTGETFPLDGAKDGEVTFIAGEFRARLPQGDVQILGPQRIQSGAPAKTATKVSAPEKEPALDPTTLEITQRAQAEALRRFPALANKNSAENQEFIETYHELKQKKSTMLDDPEWPIRLAEILAQRSNWQEAGEATDEVVGKPAPPPVGQ